jgi:predicted nucleotidyltransferase
MSLPENVEQGLSQYVAAARSAFDAQLVAVVLYGSAAEGRLRATSDVNTITVVKTFSSEAAAAIGPTLTLLAAAMRLETMFLLEAEVERALNAFPVKFADIRHRKVVLYGTDPFSDGQISREALISRLRQVLLNTVLRTRQSYALRWDKETSMVELAADMAGPMRSAASALLELKGAAAASPREALQKVAAAAGKAGWIEAVQLLPDARERRPFPAGKTAAGIVYALLELAQHILDDAYQLVP